MAFSLIKQKLFYDTPDNFEKLLNFKNDYWRIKKFYAYSENTIPAEIFPYAYFYTKYPYAYYAKNGSYHKKWIDEYSNGKIQENLIINPAKRFIHCDFEIIGKEYINFMTECYKCFDAQSYVNWKEKILNFSDTTVFDLITGYKEYSSWQPDTLYGSKIKDSQIKTKYSRNDFNSLYPSLMFGVTSQFNHLQSYSDFSTCIIIDYLVSEEIIKKILQHNFISEVQLKLKYLENDLLISNFLEGLNHLKLLVNKEKNI